MVVYNHDVVEFDSPSPSCNLGELQIFLQYFTYPEE
jgi:hypothetical protein